jgi:hypothetical protein
MKRIVGVGLVLTLVLVAGCEQQYWYQEGKTFEECRADREACRAELDRRSDLHYVSGYELKFIKDCMEQKGYRLVAASDLPLNVKRQEPDVQSAVPIDRSWGIAGSIPPSPPPLPRKSPGTPHSLPARNETGDNVEVSGKGES